MASDPVILNASGVTKVTLKSAVTANVGSLIGFDGTDFVLADADGPYSARYMSMMHLVGDGVKQLDVCTAGVLRDEDAPLTLGGKLYLSATAGAYTHTIPAASATLTILQRIGHALNTYEAAFDLNHTGPTIMRIQGAIDGSNNLTDVSEHKDTTLTGVLSTDYVRLASVPALKDGAAGAGYILTGSVVAGTDKVTIGIANPSAGTVNGGSVTADFIVERY